MRINIYAEELPDQLDSRAVERVETTTDTGRKFFGARIYLKSAESLHDEPGDDDRSAVTFWGPLHKVSELLYNAADAMAGPAAGRGRSGTWAETQWSAGRDLGFADTPLPTVESEYSVWFTRGYAAGRAEREYFVRRDARNKLTLREREALGIER